jgi:hypothetical protein
MGTSLFSVKSSLSQLEVDIFQLFVVHQKQLGFTHDQSSNGQHLLFSAAEGSGYLGMSFLLRCIEYL